MDAAAAGRAANSATVCVELTSPRVRLSIVAPPANSRLSASADA